MFGKVGDKINVALDKISQNTSGYCTSCTIWLETNAKVYM